jgi:3-oxoacyl-[acyl-carrier-protein] synthase III
MQSLNFKNVVIESLAVNLPPIEISSATLEDRLAETYQRLGIPFGTLEKLSGVASRYMWDPSVLPSHAATEVVKKVLDESNIKPDQIGSLISCSVTRDYFEPAVASIIHGNLKMKEQCLTFDISNACIGFSDGIAVTANLIESGVIQAGIVVSAEATAKMIEHNVRHLQAKEDISRDEFLKLLPTLTIGSSSVAFILCHKSLAPDGHKLKSIVSRSASQYADLCVGNGDFCMTQENFSPLMHTESGKLIASAARTGAKTWQDLQEATGWKKEDVDHVFCHQVGKQVNDAFYNEMGLEFSKEYTIYRKYGNAVSAALPTALVLGAKEKPLKKDEKIVLTAFGSGLNCRFIAIEW